MSICLFRLRDTRIEEDSQNCTISKDLLVRNVFQNKFFFSSYFVARLLENILRQAKRAELVTARCSIFSSSLDSSKTFLDEPSGIAVTARCFMFTHYVRKHSARGGIYRNANSLNRHWVSDCGTQSEERNTKCCLSAASSLSDLNNLCSGLRAQDVFEPFFVSFLSVTKEMKDNWRKKWKTSA